MRHFVPFTPLLLLLLALPGTSGAQEWVTRRPMPTPRYGVAGAVLNGWIYVIGGSQNPSESRGMAVVEAYDPDTDTWDTSIPPLAEPRLNAAAVAFGGKVYVMGGRDGSELLESVEVYDPVQGTWGSAQDLHEEKEGLAAVIHAGRIFLLGGFGDDGQFLDEVEALNVSSGNWEDQDWTLSLPRASLSAVSLADSIFTLGGLYYGPLDLVERYHETEGFEARRPLPGPRASAGSAVSGKTIYIAGGMSTEGIVATLEAYSTDGPDPTWVELEPMSKARSALTLQAWDGRLYAIGGRGGTDGDTPLDRVEEFRIATGIEESDPPSVPRAILLEQNSPNPFNGGTDIAFEVPTGGERVTVAIYDIRGRLVRTLEDRTLPAGRYVVHWDGRDRLGRDAPTNHYFCRMTRGRTIQTRKILLAR